MRAIELPLPLLVLRVRADHAHHAAAPHNLALVANPFDRCSDFHWLRSCLGLPATAYRLQQYLKPAALAFSLLHDPSASEIPRRQFNNHPIADKHANEIPLESPADVRRNTVRIDFHFVQPAWQLRPNYPLDLRFLICDL